MKEERTVYKPNTKGLKRRTSCVSEPESASEDVDMAPAAQVTKQDKRKLLNGGEEPVKKK